MVEEYQSKRRQRTSVKSKAKSPDRFLRILKIQIALCALIYLSVLGFKIISNTMFSAVKTGAFNTTYKLTNLGDLNSKLDEIARSNKLLSFFLGRQDTVSVFSNSSQSAESSEPDQNTGSSDTVSTAQNSSSVSTTQTTSVSGLGEGLTAIQVIDAIITPDFNDEIDDTQPEPDTPVIPATLDTKQKLPEKIIKPVSGYVTSPFGIRNDPFTGKKSFHTGTDIAVKSGTQVKAAMSGKVYATGYSSVGGNYILLQHKDGFMTYYGHLSKIYIKKGASVKSGAKIALSGNTGRSTGPHLHFEIRKDGKYMNTQTYISY